VYCVTLILKTAPESSTEEMLAVESWVKTQFEDVSFEGESLGGQIKFIVPNAALDGSDTEGGPARRHGNSIAHIIRTLERHKGDLGLLDYNIGAPTLERVFLSVMKDRQVEEEDEKKKAWWRW
jgi:ATP-binding cassette, subfamily A (ABC1), member 3